MEKPCRSRFENSRTTFPSTSSWCAGGEPVVVTSHRTPLAKLLPIPEIENVGLRRLLQLDWIHWSGKKPRGGTLCPEIRGKSIAESVLEDRG